MNVWILAAVGLALFFGLIYWANKEAEKEGLAETDEE